MIEQHKTEAVQIDYPGCAIGYIPPMRYQQVRFRIDGKEYTGEVRYAEVYGTGMDTLLFNLQGIVLGGHDE